MVNELNSVLDNVSNDSRQVHATSFVEKGGHFSKELSEVIFREGVQRPLNAMSQLASGVIGYQIPSLEIVDETPKGAYAERYGTAIGRAIDLCLVDKLSGGRLRLAMEAPLGRKVAVNFGVGFAQGAFLSPTESGHSLLEDRLTKGFYTGLDYAALNPVSSIYTSNARSISHTAFLDGFISPKQPFTQSFSHWLDSNSKSPD